jgi:hypothetical protein
MKTGIACSPLDSGVPPSLRCVATRLFSTVPSGFDQAGGNIKKLSNRSLTEQRITVITT